MSDVDPWDLVATVREGLLVLDSDLAILFANRSFCDAFAVAPEDAVGRKLYELGHEQWDIPELRSALGGRLVEGFAQQLVANLSGRAATRGPSCA